MYKCLFCSLCDPVLSCALARNNHSRVLAAAHASPRELTTCHSRVNPTLHARICYLTCDLYCSLCLSRYPQGCIERYFRVIAAITAVQFCLGLSSHTLTHTSSSCCTSTTLHRAPIMSSLLIQLTSVFLEILVIHQPGK